MNYKTLRIISTFAALSLLGILLTQGFWLKRSIKIAEKQFDHRADQMLTDVLNELKTYSDTSEYVLEHIQRDNLSIFDVVDTILLDKLFFKYSKNHMLDTVFQYGLVTSGDKKILYSKNNFNLCSEKSAYQACLSCVWKEEYIHMSIYFPNRARSIINSLLIWIILSGFFFLSSFVAFIYIIYNMFRQKKLAEIKNDFINNMTHELKTPISTISVAAEVLKKSSDTIDGKKLSRYSNIIFDENQRMRKLVEKVLNIATIDRGHLEIEKVEIDLHSIVCSIVNGFCFEACPKNVMVDFDLQAKNSIIMADKIHLQNIFTNLVDNAVKYSGNEPEITIHSKNEDGYIKISVADKGIGIPKESIKKVFDKFYRVPSGNLHNVKGFGLGLYYVRTIIESHKGKLDIHSNLNKGTIVSVYLPQ